MTKKFEAFKAELEALCKKHDVVIATSDYDSIVISDPVPPHWPAGLAPSDRIEDNTREPLAPPPAEGQSVELPTSEAKLAQAMELMDEWLIFSQNGALPPRLKEIKGLVEAWKASAARGVG